ncbi:hypothetical protein [Thermococcus sp. LS1]|uniref:hypothetical protein n=1 Tax=Thermococcus sp. LS1 TaxID=1638259 RepID=UPI00143B3B4B|nr:hypothetical protein [Thermococcus sp. LS1]
MNLITFCGDNMQGSENLGLEELMVWMLYLVAFLPFFVSVTAGGALLVLAEVYFVLVLAKNGRDVIQLPVPGGFILLNAVLIWSDMSWEIRHVLTALATLTFILWGIKLSTEVKP